MRNLLSLVLLLGAACARQPAVQPTAQLDVLATVGAVTIREADLRAEYVRRQPPGGATMDKEALLDQMIDRQALLNKALQAGLERDPDVARAWGNLLISKLKERELEPRLQAAAVLSGEIARSAQTNAARQVRGPQSHLALLTLSKPSTVDPETAARIEGRMAEARELALKLAPTEPGFGALAVDYSEDQATRYKGGDIGWFDADVKKYRWDTEVLAAGVALPKAGAVSEVIHAKDGLYLVKLMDRREAPTAPLKQLEASAQHRLLAQKRKQIEQDFLEQARQASPIVVAHDRLKQLEWNSPAHDRAGESSPAIAAWPGGKDR